MGRALLMGRLVTGDIKRRRTQSLLLVVMIAVTTATLTLGLALRHANESPYARTRAATKGPDLVAQNGPAPGSPKPSRAQFAPLLDAKAVAATSGPFPVAFTRLTSRGINVPVDAEGRYRAPAAVDQPLLTAGHWVSSSGAVIEQGLAEALDLHVGDTIHLGRHPFTVVGIAVTAARAFYPATTPGLVWLTKQDATALATPSEPLGYVLNIKLIHGASKHAMDGPDKAFALAGNVPALVWSSSAIQDADYKLLAFDRKVLLIGSTLLALLAIASIAVLVGGRMAEQTRRVGLLKAVGATPGMVAVALLCENLLLAVAAAAIGLLAGAGLAPVLASPGHGLLGSAPTPPVTASSIVIVLGVAVAVAAAATIAPALRGARTTTLSALADSPHPPRRRPMLITLSARLPVPLLLGLRIVARRTRRSVLTAASLTLAVAMVVAALTVQHDLSTHASHASAGFFTASGVVQSANHVLVLLSVILVTLAAISATFTAWATVIDTQVPTALARALGATPHQVTAGLTTAQLLPGIVAAVVGLPAGLLLYQLSGGNLTTAIPPLWWLLAVVPVTLIIVAGATAVPAAVGSRRPVAEVLRTE